MALALCAGVVLLAAATGSLHAAQDPAGAIRAADLMAHVRFLADDGCAGREAGTPGGQRAGDYLVEQLSRLRLAARGTAGYAQPFGAKCRNLLGLVEGSDAALKDQYVLVCAHYDHLGYGRGTSRSPDAGKIHPGADDNASGVSGVLEIARALAAPGVAPRRSVLVAFWDAEEIGLLGSKHWIDHPTLPWERLAAVVNFDMIGRVRDDRVVVYGARTAAGLRRLVAQGNAAVRLEIDFTWALLRNGDHHNFAQCHVPVLMFHTGLHPDYHRAGDTVEKLNAVGMERVARLAFAAVRRLADADQPPRYREASARESDALWKNQPMPAVTPGKPMRLGVFFRWDEAEPGCAAVTHVVPGLPAARAGLQGEDRIEAINGRPFATEAEFLRLIAEAPGAIDLKIERKGITIHVTVPERVKEGEGEREKGRQASKGTVPGPSLSPIWGSFPPYSVLGTPYCAAPSPSDCG